MNAPAPTDATERLLARTRARLAAFTLTVVTALVLAVGLTTALTATTLMRQSIDRALDATVADQRFLHDLVEGEEEDEYRAPLGEADTFVMLVDADGRLLGASAGATLAGLPDLAAIRATATSGHDRRDGSYGGTDVRLLTIEAPSRLMDDDEVRSDAPVYLQAGFNLTLHHEQERQLLLAIALIASLGILGAVVVTSVVTRRALVPIRDAFATERRFVAAASHELRTPVSIIRASAEILQREGLVDPAGAPLVTDIVGETDRLGRLVGDLLALASVEVGAITLDLRAFDIDTWFTDLARRAASIGDPRGVTVEPRLHAHASSWMVTGDRDRLDQLVLILVDNAVRHSPRNGVVRLELGVGEGASEATVAVRDEGPGIPAGDLERIFEPFARVAGRRDADHGSGLGLAIARQLAGRHGADLSVTSAPGQGATFRLRLPLTASRPGTTISPEHLPAG